VIDMELLSFIRRWHFRDHFSIREISRRTGLSRNTVRKYLRTESEEPKFNIPDRPSGLDPYADKLSHMLRQEGGKSRKQKRTILQLHADLVALGYEGSYNRDGGSGDKLMKLKVVLPKPPDPELEAFVSTWTNGMDFNPREGNRS
jgi:hypothetical protein